MIYKGFSTNTKKENEGYSIFACRQSDNWILVNEWNPSLKTKQEALEEMKIIIDDYIANPEHYE